MDRIPILLDTDIGSDIDDAVALAYLLCQPRAELLGVTTVTGDVQKRAALVELICNSAGRTDIPIHCGRRDVLANGPGQPNVPQFDAVKDRGLRLDRPENTAVEFLRSTIRSRPGEITLLTIGPFSNIALLFALDPEIPFLLKNIVSMAGCFYHGPQQEWNCVCDPVSTAMIYRAPRKDHLTVGLDVTGKCRLESSEVRSKFVGEVLGTVAELAENWFTNSDHMTFHDPLAAALLFRPELCTYEAGQIETVLGEDPATWGHTTLSAGEGPDRVTKTVNVEGFFQEFFSVTAPHLAV